MSTDQCRDVVEQLFRREDFIGPNREQRIQAIQPLPGERQALGGETERHDPGEILSGGRGHE
jgi:hypothetical protein